MNKKLILAAQGILKNLCNKYSNLSMICSNTKESILKVRIRVEEHMFGNWLTVERQTQLQTRHYAAQSEGCIDPSVAPSYHNPFKCRLAPLVLRILLFIDSQEGSVPQTYPNSAKAGTQRNDIPISSESNIQAAHQESPSPRGPFRLPLCSGSA